MSQHFLIQVNLVGQPYGLSCQETNDLWKQADIDGNGVVSYEEFKVLIISFHNFSCLLSEAVFITLSLVKISLLTF